MKKKPETKKNFKIAQNNWAVSPDQNHWFINFAMSVPVEGQIARPRNKKKETQKQETRKHENQKKTPAFAASAGQGASNGDNGGGIERRNELLFATA